MDRGTWETEVGSKSQVEYTELTLSGRLTGSVVRGPRDTRLESVSRSGHSSIRPPETLVRSLQGSDEKTLVSV